MDLQSHGELLVLIWSPINPHMLFKAREIKASLWDKVQMPRINRGTVRTSFLHINHKHQPLRIPLALLSVSVLSKSCIKNLCFSCNSVCRGLFVKGMLMYEGDA